MIAHTRDLNQIPSQKKTKWKLQISKHSQKFNFQILQEALYVTHLLNLLDMMYKYEMDPTKNVGATERTRDAGRMDSWMDGRTDRQT